MQFIGIAGGSGTGKSTVSHGLADAEPDVFEVINLDDYQYLEDAPNLPMIHGKINWDHLDIIRWDELLVDMEKLERGEAVTINVWSHRSNPDYFKHGNMIPRTLQPRPIIIIEGYLALCNSRLNERYTRRYYLDLNEATRAARRKNKIIYEADVVMPMHNQYVEPTKKYADMVIDVASLKMEEVQRIMRADIAAHT